MAFTVRLQENIVKGDDSISQTQSYTCGTVLQLEETVADSTTDQEHLLALDISALQVFYMVSDVAMTVETNNGTTPQETFTLTANKPVTFRTGDTAIFAGDVTKLLLTTGAVGVGTFKLMAGLDV